jgi:hypothetical protein
VLGVVPGVPGDWREFGLMLSRDQYSEDPDVRAAAARVIDALLDFLNAKNQVVV